MLQVVDAGGQAALLAPTEVLAQQHYRSISEMLGPLGRGRRARRRRAGDQGRAAHRLAGGGRPAAGPARRRVRRGRASSSARTRCCEDQVQFADLGLVVIDEQHRFGVEQRDALRDKAGQATAARAGDDRDADPAHGRHDRLRRPGDLHADRAARPAGRRSPRTWCRPRRSRSTSTGPGSGCPRRSSRGRQAYVVCPRIGDGPQEPEEPGGRSRRKETAARNGGRPPRSPSWPRSWPRRPAGRAAARRAARPAGTGREGRGHAGVRGRARSTCWSPPR